MPRAGSDQLIGTGLLKGLGVTPREPSAPLRRTVDGVVEQALKGGIRRVLYVRFRQGEAEAEQEADPQAYLPRVTALVDSLEREREPSAERLRVADVKGFAFGGVNGGWVPPGVMEEVLRSPLSAACVHDRIF